MKYKLLGTVLLSISILFISALSNAQSKIGIRAGMNLSKVSLTDQAGDKLATQLIPGISLGLTIDIPLVSDFYVQPAVLYSDRGFKQQRGGFYGLADDFEVNVSYFELPVNVLYKPVLGAGRVILSAGPYIAYGTGGKWKASNNIIFDDIVTDTHGDVNFKNDLSDGEFGAYTYGKPFDYGVNFSLGYKFLKQCSVQLNTQLGLANLQPVYAGANPKGSIKNRSTGFSLGYKF